MPFTKTHASIRQQLTAQVLTLVTELSTLAAPAARLTSLGSISEGDGGAAATGEIRTPILALSELISGAVGDPDFSIPVTVRGTASALVVNRSTSTGLITAPSSATVTVNNLLPKPLVTLHRGGTTASLNISSRAVIFGNSYDPSVNVAAAESAYATLSINLVGLAIDAPATPFVANNYKIVVSNPLDAGSGTATFFYTVAAVN